MPEAGENICPECGKERRMLKAAWGLAPLPIECRACSGRALGAIYWMWVVACVPILPLAIGGPLLPEPVGPITRGIGFTLLLLVGVSVTQRSGTLKTKWPKLRADWIFANEDATRDGPPPHTPVAPPTMHKTSVDDGKS